MDRLARKVTLMSVIMRPADPALVSVVIPTWRERENIDGLLSSLGGDDRSVEIIVADAGSGDGTAERAGDHGSTRVTTSPRGRARQLNRGAEAARGEILWFLHADSRPPEGAVDLIRRTLDDSRISLGAFRFAIDSPRWRYRIIELGVRVRARWFGVPYGDQGFFLRRSAFEKVGGFRDIPVLEDLYLVRALKRQGRIAIVEASLPTSARRWEQLGAARVTLRNWKIIALDWAGVSPARLARVWRGSATDTMPGS
ncbi:MAG: glycosyltransferase [Dehalococcoidia bacterium]|nr:glycosyltransferase [Dehalococcoidia bacterium]